MNDLTLIERLRKIIPVSKKGEEWFAQLPDDAVRESVLIGLEQAERGEVIPHEQFKPVYEKWLKKLSGLQKPKKLF